MKKALLILLASSVLLQACLPPAFRAHPTLAQRGATIKTVLVAPPKVEVFELGAGGMREKMDEWSDKAKKNIEAALQQSLASRPALRARLLPEESLPQEVKSDLEETLLLYEAVDNAIVLHTYGPAPERFEEKFRNFDYSLGPETKKLKVDEADALLLIRAVDHVSSQGRIAQQVALVIVAAALGVAVVPQGGTTALSIALVDANSGLILWHQFLRAGGAYDLRDANSARRFIDYALEDFPLR